MEWTFPSYIFRGLIDVSAETTQIPGTRTPGSRTGPQPQLDRTLAVKSRWGGDEGPAHQIQHICGRSSKRKRAAWTEPQFGRLILVNHGVYTHLSHTHTLLIGQLSHSELPTPLWVKSKHRSQVLPVSDHYLVSYFQLSLGDGFFAWSPG